MSTTSPQGLLENLRKVITLVDQLRDIGLNDYIKLPRIVVLGIQSAGKSSLLEQIVGIDFLPRGSGVVTRRPLELRLSYVPKSLQNETTAEFIHEIKGKKFTDFNQVKEKIVELTDKVCGTSKNIIDNPIILAVQGPNCPDLTLVDLPGITRIPLPGQDKNIEKVTTDMARRYCEDPSTIILCAVAANADMATSDALQLAIKLDPNGERTIGVLTKIDIMDTGTNALAMLKNEEVPLKYGYVGVKLRSQQDINDNINVQVAIQKEKNFFANHPVYASIPGEVFGCTVLTTKLTRILYRHIRGFLPKLMEEINQRVGKIEDRVKSLGPGLPIDDADKLHYLWQLIHEFSVKFRNSITGQYEKSKSKQLALAPAGAKIRLLFQDLFEEFVDDDYQALKKKKESDIQAVIQKYQAMTIPGFLPVDAFYALLDPELKKLNSPATECVEETYAILETYANTILDNQLKQLPLIQAYLKEQVYSILQECKKEAAEAVLEVLEAELNYIFTNDYNYLAGKPFLRYANTEAKDNKSTKGDPMVNELKSKIEHYFKLVVRATRDNIPKLIGFFLVKGCQTKMLISLQQNLMQSQSMLEVLSEPAEVVEERIKLNKEIEIFRNAQKIIKRDPDLSQYILQVSEESNQESPRKIDKKKKKEQEQAEAAKQAAAAKEKQQQQEQANKNVNVKTDVVVEKPIQKPNDTTTKPNQGNTPQQQQQQQQNGLFKQQQPQQQQPSQQQITAQIKPNNNPLDAKKPQSNQSLTQQYNQGVDNAVGQVMQDQRVTTAMSNAGGAAAKSAVQSQIPGAPDWMLGAAEKAGQQAATSDAAKQAATNAISGNLKVGEQPPAPAKPAPGGGLFGFIKK